MGNSRVRRRLGSKKLGKLTFRLRAKTGKRADIFSRLDGFIERASRAPIENDENWTDVSAQKKKCWKRERGRREETSYNARSARRARDASQVLPDLAIAMSPWTAFFFDAYARDEPTRKRERERDSVRDSI